MRRWIPWIPSTKVSTSAFDHRRRATLPNQGLRMVEVVWVGVRSMGEGQVRKRFLYLYLVTDVSWLFLKNIRSLEFVSKLSCKESLILEVGINILWSIQDMGISWQHLSYKHVVRWSFAPVSADPFAWGWKQITNLSGGEKTLASLSLVFALHHYRQGQQIPSLCWRCCGVLLFSLCSASLLGCNCCNVLDVKCLGKATFAAFCCVCVCYN